jgi:Raf kinase inhibitor-like YbhB/YbcL family protein
MPFTISSPTIPRDAEIPVEHTCDGGDRPPDLNWADVPAGTAELLLLMDDPDAKGFVHWLVARIPAGTAQIVDGVVPLGAVELTNGFGRTGYGGPCPPHGQHRYDFTLFALSNSVALPGSPSGAQVRRAVASSMLATAELHARYARRR